MLVYILMALMCYFILFLSKKQNDYKVHRILIVCAFLLMFIISAIRVDVGTDYKSYCKWFDDVVFLRFRYENFAFNLLIIIIKLFTNNPQWLFVLTSFIVLAFVYISIIKEQKEYDISIFLFIVLGFYFSTFNGVRQWIACSMFMFAYYFATHKKLIPYIVLIIFASLFHISAILLLPFYFIFNLKIDDKIKIIIVMVALIVFKFFNFNVITASFLKLVSINYYWRYISSGVDLRSGVGSIFPILISGCMMAYYIVFKNSFLSCMPKEKYEKRKNLSFIIVVFSIINTVNNLFSRFAMYFVPMLVFILPDTYLIYNEKWKKIFKILIIVGGLSFMVINTLLKNSNNPLPYNSIFGI